MVLPAFCNLCTTVPFHILPWDGMMYCSQVAALQRHIKMVKELRIDRNRLVYE